MKSCGVRDVTVLLYSEARHELVNETNRETVTGDVIAWLDARLPTRGRAEGVEQLSPA